MSLFGFALGRRLGADQIVEQGAKVDHPLPKVLGARLTTPIPNGDVMGLVIMFDDDRVIDGNVPDPLVEVADRITSRLHHIPDQRVSECNRSRRIVDEPRLNVVPATSELAALRRAQRPDIEFLHPALALGKIGLSLRTIALRLNGPVIFRAESVAQVRRARSARPQECANDQRRNYDNPNDDPGGLSHVLLLREVLGMTTNGPRRRCIRKNASEGLGWNPHQRVGAGFDLLSKRA